MKHLGDISKINGAEIDPVDIITFGSPCQDLSVAGKRAGLGGARSGLFMEAVRIIREMREATNGQYPTFALWENVPGAFSSNKGEDFRIVLEELIKIAEPSAAMPEVPPFGWAYADSYSGDGWSLAYRVFDAQYWGVPQRRRRIHLVADFRGQRAREVLFEREGLRGHLTESPPPRERVTVYVEGGSGAADVQGFDGYNSTLTGETSSTLGVNCGISTGRNGVMLAVATQQGGAEVTENGICPTVTAAAGMSGNNQPWVVYNDDYPVYSLQGNTVDRDAKQRGLGVSENTAYTLNVVDRHAVCCPEAITVHGETVSGSLLARDYKGAGRWDSLDKIVCCPDEVSAIVFDKEVYQSGKNASGGHYISEGGPAPSLRTTGSPPGVCVAGVDCRNMNEYPELYPTLQAKPNGGQSLNFSGAVRDQYIVRRLTPTECARLQGFSDKWGHPDQKGEFSDAEYSFWLDVRNTHAAINGKAVKEYTKDQMLKWYNKLHSDSAEYKMWGNGIALPPALYCMQGMTSALEESHSS